MRSAGSLADALRRRMKVPGLAVAVLAGGRVQALATSGLASLERGEPVAERTRFHYYSLTKLVTAVAVLQLVESGLLDVNGSVRAYLPWVPWRTPGPGPTVLELLSHRSGFGRETASFSFHLAGERRAAQRPLLRRMLAKALRGRPGTRSRYSNVNYALLAEVIEALSGQTFEDYVRARILEPLGMRDTSFQVGGAARGYLKRWSVMHWMSLWAFSSTQRARLYPRTTGGWLELEAFELDGKGFGGLVGSIADLATFLRFHLESGPDHDEVLSARGRQMMREVGRGPFACGWSRWSEGGWSAFGHLGGGPGYLSYASIVPELRSGVALLANAFAGRMPDISSLSTAR